MDKIDVSITIISINRQNNINEPKFIINHQGNKVILYPEALSKQIKVHQLKMSQTFQQKRIVQLSKRLDQERSQNQKLIKQTHDQAKQLTYVRQCYQKQLALRQQLQLTQRQLRQQLQKKNNENMTLLQQKSVLQKKLIQSEYTVLRLKQQIQQLKQQHQRQKAQLKTQIFQLQKTIQLKQKQIMKQREQNLQLQKLYLNKRQQLQRNTEKHFRQLNKLSMNFKLLKNQILQFGKTWELNVKNERLHVEGLCQQFHLKVEQLDHKISTAKQLNKIIADLQIRLEDVVVENSQRIIEVYNLKYQDRIST